MAISAGLLVPCFWHRRIEAGDLASHVYNAWLAQLIERGQAPGLYLARQWNNVLFDLLLLNVGNLFGLSVAQKIVVPLCVLIFFWGAFALIAAVSRRPPWFLLPCLGMLAYGWTFNVGFFNYYLSLGFGFFATAIAWREWGGEVILAVVLAALALVAHPPAGIYNGSDQLALYGTRYSILSGMALLFGVACFAADRLRRDRAQGSWAAMRVPLELHWFAVFAIYVLPDVLRVPFYSGWVGALALRLTTVAAVMGLCVLAFMQPRSWHTAGFAIIAIVFFAFLYQDTATLNRMEAQIEGLIASSVPSGGRVTATILAPSDSRLPYIVHMVDRACVGKCFSFQNYEAPSRQFRVRVAEDGSPLNTDDSHASQQMEVGEYVVRPGDLPIAQIYQCDEHDLTRLCVRQLVAGEANGGIGYHPPKD